MTTKRDDRALRALQMILNACAVQRYVAPFDVVVTDARGTRIAVQIDHDGAKPLAGAIAHVGLICPPLNVLVTDACGKSAEFVVELLDAGDGSPLPPIIIYPSTWTKAA